MKKTIRDIDVSGKRIFVRVDYNVPMNTELKIVDDTRIVETLPTINYLLSHGAKVILCSHLGRPNGQVDTKLSLRPVLARLSKLLDKPISFAEDILGEEVETMIKDMQDGEVLMLENIRFYEQEETNDAKFAKRLASFADIFVIDAFATAHRKHASTYGVAELLPNAVGYLMGKEISVIENLLTKAEKPFVAILGGAKIEDKIPVIENLIKKVNTILIGGGMSYTFIKAQGGSIGQSLVDDTKLDLAKKLLAKAAKNGVEIVLPVDVVANTEFANKGKIKKFPANAIPDDYQGLDIGPKTRKLFKKYIKDAKTVIWNGPVGVCEFDNFKVGTDKIAKALAKSKAFSFIGGGDSAAAIIKLGYSSQISHISTGGGASLTMLEGKKLPGVEIISNKRK